jgi:hypothetical protein
MRGEFQLLPYPFFEAGLSSVGVAGCFDVAFRGINDVVLAGESHTDVLS